MWTWSLNWGEITPDIFVGSCPMTAKDLGRIQKGTGVSALMSLQTDDCLAYWKIDYPGMKTMAERLGLIMERYPIRDFDPEDARRRMPGAVSRLADLRGAGHRVYVHCTAGLGRAPVTVISYLVLVESFRAEDAFRLVKECRPGAVPAWEAYAGCREDLVSRHRARIEARAHERSLQSEDNSMESDWKQAEAEVLREVLTGGEEADEQRVCD